MKFNFKKVYIDHNNKSKKKQGLNKKHQNQKLLKFPDDHWKPDAKKEMSN